MWPDRDDDDATTITITIATATWCFSGVLAHVAEAYLDVPGVLGGVGEDHVEALFLEVVGEHRDVGHDLLIGEGQWVGLRGLLRGGVGEHSDVRHDLSRTTGLRVCILGS